MGVILFNKWILAYSGFKYPIALTLWHMVFCTTVATVLMRVFKVTKRLSMPRKEYVSRVLPIGAFYAASLWLSNSAYLHLSVSFIQMTKALMPGLVYFVGHYIPNGEVSRSDDFEHVYHRNWGSDCGVRGN